MIYVGLEKEVESGVGSLKSLLNGGGKNNREDVEEEDIPVIACCYHPLPPLIV